MKGCVMFFNFRVLFTWRRVKVGIDFEESGAGQILDLMILLSAVSLWTLLHCIDELLSLSFVYWRLQQQFTCLLQPNFNLVSLDRNRNRSSQLARPYSQSLNTFIKSSKRSWLNRLLKCPVPLIKRWFLSIARIFRHAQSYTIILRM